MTKDTQDSTTTPADPVAEAVAWAEQSTAPGDVKAAVVMQVVYDTYGSEARAEEEKS